MSLRTDFADGVKRAAFEHALECGDPLALPFTEGMTPNEERLHINAWFRLAAEREPYLKILVRADVGDLPFTEPEIYHHPEPPRATPPTYQMLLLGQIWDATWRYHHSRYDNRDLTKSGACYRHGLAALYQFSAAFRHYRKKARIKGDVCRPDAEGRPGYNRQEGEWDPGYIRTLRHGSELAEDQGRDRHSEDERFAEQGTLYEGYVYTCGWEHQLIKHWWVNRKLSLAARLAKFKYEQDVKRRRRNEEQKERRAFKHRVLDSMSVEEVRKLLIEKEAHLTPAENGLEVCA